MLKEDILEIKSECIGIAFPVYYGGIPKIVNKVVKKIKAKKELYIFALATYGGMPANPMKLLDEKLKYKGLNLNSGFLVSMPDNYIPVIGARRESVQIKNFKNSINKIEKISKIIKNKSTIKYEKSPYIIDRHFSAMAEKKVYKLSKRDENFNVDNKCTKCGTCVKICPVNNIEFKDNQIKWLGKCEQCMSCIQYCPNEAIQYKNSTIKRKRYRNPNVDYFKVLLKKKRYLFRLVNLYI